MNNIKTGCDVTGADTNIGTNGWYFSGQDAVYYAHPDDALAPYDIAADS